MGTRLKAILWALSLLTVIYASSQYKEAQRLRSSGHTQHSSHRDPSYRLTEIGGQLMRVNETTGETHYWSSDGGGWVLIGETSLQTAVSKEEREKKKTIVQSWQQAMKVEGLGEEVYTNLDLIAETMPSWQIEENFNQWKKKREELKREQRKLLIRSLYDKATEEYKRDVPYQTYEANLINSSEFEQRREVIKSWHDVMSPEYKQKVPLERFEALLISQPLANLRAGFEKEQQKGK